SKSKFSTTSFSVAAPTSVPKTFFPCANWDTSTREIRGTLMIHRTAVIHPKAQVDSTVEVGAYAVIDEHVIVGARCRIGPHVHLTGHSRIGEDNEFHAGCVIGDAPQDLRYKGEATRVRIGDRNVFREHMTVHRSKSLNEDTVIGSDNFLM